MTSFSITELTKENDAHTRSRNGARAARRASNPYDPKQNYQRTMAKYKDAPTTFVAIDGEGITLPDGSHRYVLLGVGDQQITNPNGLEFEEILDFLWEQYLEHGSKSVAYVGFFLTYDFVQWVKKLPEERAKMLLSSEGKAKRKPKSSKRPMPFPVRYGEWEFDILGVKRFKLRKIGGKRWMNICDAGPFFQKSFIKVIDPAEWSDPIVSQEEYDEIATGKARRSNAVLDRDMLSYNARENEILARVLCRLNEGFHSLGISLRPGQWFGPGQAAQAWLGTRAITTERLAEVVPREVLECARMSYIGGWFEIFIHGIIYDITHEYDINSAYPYIISRLPCLEHGKWERGKYDETGYSLVYAEVTGSNPYIGTMLHRDAKGNIYRPHHTEGWYWLHEILAAQRAGLIDTCRIRDSWNYVPCDCLPPMREVQEIYNLRKQVGKKTPLGIACKLVPNSLYGKFAQSVGSPKYANPIYASLITAGCRTMILNAIATHPDGAAAVTMVATDGVYFRTPHPNLPISGELGDWEHNEKHDLCQFKPGVYWDNKARKAISKGEAPLFKARGVNARDFAREISSIDSQFKMFEPYLNHLQWPQVEFPVTFAMITASQALQRNDWSLAGTIINNPVAKQSANPESKRDTKSAYFDGNMLRTKPRKNIPYEPCHPYEKRFGMDDPFSDENAEKSGVTPDGLVGHIVREALGI